MISIICPTRKRPKLCITSCESLLNKASIIENVELLFAFDEDDIESKEIVDNYFKNKNVLFKSFLYPRFSYKNLHEYVNRLSKEASGDWLFLWNDDATMETHGWDEIVKSYKNKFVLISPVLTNHTGCCFPIIPSEWVKITGRFSNNCSNDTWVELIAQRLNIFVYENRIKVLHERGDFCVKNIDDTFHERVYDSEKFYQQENEREEDAEKIKHWLETVTTNKCL